MRPRFMNRWNSYSGTLAENAPPPEPVQQPVLAAEGIKEAVASENQTIGGLIETLDSYAINVGTMHVSVWSALVVLMILVGIVIFARLVSKFVHWLLGKITTLDSTQRLLSEKTGHGHRLAARHPHRPRCPRH